MKIIPLSEGSFTIDKTKIFIPFNKYEDDLQQRALGSLLVEVQPFAVITKTDIIVIDTGLGFSVNGNLQIHQNLLANGISPRQVSKVLLSHLHKDHAGGISDIQKNQGEPRLSFENATYYVSKKELDFAIEKEGSSYEREDFNLLINSSQVSLLLDYKGNISGGIEYEISGGHSPFHTVFWIKEDAEVIFFGGDVAPQLQQMKSRFIAKYDFDGKKCMELRAGWWLQAEREHWTMLFYHDIKSPSVTK